MGGKWGFSGMFEVVLLFLHNFELADCAEHSRRVASRVCARRHLAPGA